VTAPDPGRVLRRALLAWGLGHLAIGRRLIGRGLLAAEIVGIGLVAWLTAGLADSSLYLVPFIAGCLFLVAWAWQAVDAYGSAQGMHPARAETPARSPAAAMGWLALPLLAWASGFWVFSAGHATPAAVLDRFVTDWADGGLEEDAWPSSVVREADAAGRELDTFRDLRLRVASEDAERATAVAESVHFERRDSRFLGIFAGSELVPVSDGEVLRLELEADPVELPGGGDIGAVRWVVVDARRAGT
jgi:hypothetical protein